MRNGSQTQNLNHQGLPQLEMVKVMIPLMDQNSEPGTLSLITGSHLLNLKPPFDLNDFGAIPELRTLEVKPGTGSTFNRCGVVIQISTDL